MVDIGFYDFTSLDPPSRGHKIRHGVRVRCFLVKEYESQMTAWCKLCDHNTVAKKANCSRQWSIPKHSDDAHKDRVRRYLWWWCQQARGKSRFAHRKMLRELPETKDLLPVEDVQELIEDQCDSDGGGF